MAEAKLATAADIQKFMLAGKDEAAVPVTMTVAWTL